MYAYVYICIYIYTPAPGQRKGRGDGRRGGAFPPRPNILYMCPMCIPYIDSCTWREIAKGASCTGCAHFSQSRTKGASRDAPSQNVPPGTSASPETDPATVWREADSVWRETASESFWSELARLSLVMASPLRPTALAALGVTAGSASRGGGGGRPWTFLELRM